MNEIEVRERLIAVYNALNNIEVKGFHNISTLAGCLQIIKETLEAQTQMMDDASKE